MKSTVRADTTARHIDKYESRNPVQRWLLERFHRHIRAWIDELRPVRVLDFGCGEGYFWEAMARLGPIPDVVGLDVREDALQAARRRLPGLTFLRQDLFDFNPAERFDLVVASETLEHLYEPARVLAQLCRLSRGSVLLTVPPSRARAALVAAELRGIRVSDGHCGPRRDIVPVHRAAGPAPLVIPDYRGFSTWSRQP